MRDKTAIRHVAIKCTPSARVDNFSIRKANQGLLISLYLSTSSAIVQQIHCIPLYHTVSSCIYTYLAVSAVSRCISPYSTASKTGYDQKYTPGEGFQLCLTCSFGGAAVPACSATAHRLRLYIFTSYIIAQRLAITAV